MAGVYEYIIQMQDRASGTLQKLTGTSYEAVQKFVQLQDKTEALQRHTRDFGNSISGLKQKIDILQQERDLIDPKNLPKLRQYNKEIASLNKQIHKLETTTSGNKFKTYAKDAVSQIPGAGLLTNPLVLAGAGVTAAGKLAVGWEEGMAKINATAQLPQDELKKLGTTIRKLGMDVGANLSTVPDAYEKILSQTGDVALSTDILDSALKGAKAGFTDVNVVSGAVAQSLSAIGKENANASEVLDTLFAAKRVGAGEFKDFASYIPSLVATGQNVGVTWRETAGAFAYMTGKGNDAASSTMLLQNAFNSLGKSEITEGLKKAGVAVFDNEGKMRGLVDIMTELGALTKSMSDQGKSEFFESIGLRDQQAKQAFAVLTNDTGKLQTAMEATANSGGELQKALDNTDNPANKMRDALAKLQGIGMSFGNVVLTVLNPLLDVLSGVLGSIGIIVQGISDVWGWWVNALQNGNPFIIAVTATLGLLTAAMIAHNIWLKRDVIWTNALNKAKAVSNTVMKAGAALQWVITGATTVYGVVMTWLKGRIDKVRNAMLGASAGGGVMSVVMGVASVAARGFGMALRAVGKAFYSIPIVGWIAAAISALVALFSLLWKRSEKFRGFMGGLFGSLKAIFHNIGVFFGIVWDTILKPVVDAIGAGFNWLKNSVFKPLGGFFANIWNGIGSGLQWLGDKFSGIWNWITGVLEKVGLKFTGFWDFVKSLFKLGAKILFWPFTLLMKLFPNLGAWLEEKVWTPIKAVFEKITKRIGKLIEPIKKIWGKLFKNEKYEDVGKEWEEGAEKEKEKWRKEQEEKENKTSGTGDLMAGLLNNGMDDVNMPTMPGGNNTGKAPSSQLSQEGPSLGIPQLQESSAYLAITHKLGGKPETANEISREDEKAKSVKSIADRVIEINGSLKKMAAATAIPIVMAAGAGNVAAMPQMPETPTSHIVETTEKINAPHNAVTENYLYNNVNETSDKYDHSTSIDKSNRQVTNQKVTNNNKNESGKTVYIDRFCDKIEIHVSDSKATPAETGEMVKDEVIKALEEIFNV